MVFEPTSVKVRRDALSGRSKCLGALKMRHFFNFFLFLFFLSQLRNPDGGDAVSRVYSSVDEQDFTRSVAAFALLSVQT